MEQQAARDAGLGRDVLDRELVERAGREHLDAELDQLGPAGGGVEPGASPGTTARAYGTGRATGRTGAREHHNAIERRPTIC